MQSLSQEAGRLLRILSDSARKREIAKYSDGMRVCGAHFEEQPFFEILRRSLRLAVTLREFDDQPTFLADVIRPRPLLPILKFETYTRANKVILDLNQVRSLTVTRFLNDEGNIEVTFPSGKTANWRISAPDAERTAKLLTENPDGFITVYSVKESLQICVLVGADIAAMMHDKPDTLDVHFSDGTASSYRSNRPLDAMAEFSAGRR